MRTKSQYCETRCSRLADGGLPINTCRSGIHNDQGRLLIAGRCQTLLESWQCAYRFYLHTVMAQGVAHFHREEEVLFERKDVCCHSCSALVVRWLKHGSTEEVTQFLVNHVHVRIQVP